MDYQYDMNRITYKNFILSILKWLMKGLALTTVTSIIVSIICYFNPIILASIYFLTIFACIAEVAMVLIFRKKAEELSLDSAKKYFYAYSIINGITLSLLLVSVSPGAAVLAFALTVAYFGLLYNVVKNTDHDFVSVGRFCLSVLPIVIIGYIILIFFNAPILYYVLITVDLVLFTGITLYDMQKIEKAYYQAPDHELEALSMICALDLYLDFINIFIDILILISDN